MQAKRWMWGVIVVVLAAGTPAWADTHSELQAVDTNGNLTYYKVGADPFTSGNLVVLEGIVLNNPEGMLDPSSQWQIFLQGEGVDTAGTSIWAGAFYQSSVWADELIRLNASGFREGDRIRVTGYAMAVGGKANINERHSSAPELDFTIELLQTGVGLPTAELTTIQAMRTFDATRQTGGEYFQNRRMRLEHIALASGVASWDSNTTVTIVDPDDPTATLPLKLCNVDFGTQLPATWFNIVGLGNQEPQFAGYPIPGTGLVDGYQVWVTRADGIEVPGDCNLDGSINGSDLAIMASHWNDGSADWLLGDFTGEGLVDGADLALMASNWNYGPSAGASMMSFAEALEAYPTIPEPGTPVLLSGGLAALIRRRMRSRSSGQH